MDGLSHRLKQRREEMRFTQAKLGELAGMSQQSIQLIEAGETQRPRKLLELANALKCDATWLAYGSSGPRAA